MARVIVIDDQLSVRAMVRSILEPAGHEVRDFADARIALRAVNAGCDVVITDVIMPGMDGLEVLAHLKLHHAGLPVIVVTGGWRNSTVDLLSVTDRLGASISLSKSRIAEDLLGHVNALTAAPAVAPTTADAPAPPQSAPLS